MPTATVSENSAVSYLNSRAAPQISNLTLRLLVALCGIPLLVAAVFFGDPWYMLLVLAVTLAGAWEFVRLASTAEGDPLAPLVYISAALFVLDAWWKSNAAPLILASTIFLSLAWSVFRFRRGRDAVGWLWTLGGALYVGWLMSHYIWLRDLPLGSAWVLLALFGTFLNDTASYSVGRLFGRHKMAPEISPGKTWEGAFGGLVATTLGVPVLVVALGLPQSWPIWALGCVLSLAAQLGDLAESTIKRTAEVKDASGLVPGHGGVLDRIDSLVFVGPLVYYYLLWVVAPR